MSVPIPSPYFPEPITIPGNVAASGYHKVVAFARGAAIANLTSAALIVLLGVLWSRPQAAEFLLQFGPERLWLGALLSFTLLAAARHAHWFIQSLLFLVFALCLGGTAALWAPTVADDFPDFAKALGWTFASGWVGLVLYNLLATRDYSFLGQYVLVWCATVVSITIYTWLSDIVASLAFATVMVFSVALFYYLYDLSMILRRRRPGESYLGALDLYRDALNFVGYPVRVMRRPRGLQRRTD